MRFLWIVNYLFFFFFFQDRIASGEPEEGDKRLEEFKKNKQMLVDIVSKIVRTRRGEEGHGQLEEIPFIDSLLQNYSSEDKVGGCINSSL